MGLFKTLGEKIRSEKEAARKSRIIRDEREKARTKKLRNIRKKVLRYQKRGRTAMAGRKNRYF